MCDQANPPYTGRGQQLPQYFDEHLVVANYADSGESSGSFLANEALMSSLEKRIRPGGHVMVQFGHNDKPPRPQTIAGTWARFWTASCRAADGRSW